MRFINVHQTLSTLAALAALSAGCTKNAPIAAEEQSKTLFPLPGDAPPINVHDVP